MLDLPSGIASDPRTVRYIPPPTVAAWHNPSKIYSSLGSERTQARFLRGPIGSAKTTGLIFDPYIMAHLAEPCRDGIRRTRAVFLRNDYPTLRSTTIKSWEEWFGVDRGYNRVVYTSPIKWEHEWRYRDAPTVRLEVWFLSVDRPDDVKKLRGLETTFGYGSEAAEMPFEMIEMLAGRCGRYPSANMRPDHVPKEHWPTLHGMAHESNSPSDQSWWYELEVNEQPKGFDFHIQPGGMSEDAENLENLPGGRNYYVEQMRGKSKDYVDAYIHNKFTNITSGLPVWPDFNRDYHVAKKSLELHKNEPLWFAFDFGLTPACLVFQTTRYGQLRVLREITTRIATKAAQSRDPETGLLPGQKTVPDFVKSMVLPVLAEYSRIPGMEFRGVADPSGNNTTSIGKSELFYVQEHLPFVKPCRSNVFVDRRTAVSERLTRMVAGEASLIIDPGCKVLIRGCEGEFNLEQKMVSSANGLRYKMEPDKQGATSHICDCLGYGAIENSDYDSGQVRLPLQSDLRPIDAAYGR